MKVFRVVSMVLFIAYPSVSVKIFRLFRCLSGTSAGTAQCSSARAPGVSGGLYVSCCCCGCRERP